MAHYQPSISITEQPAKTYRFRYQSEIERHRNRNLASIKGASSSPSTRTYPTIRINGYEGPFLVQLTLVDANNGRVHPHSLQPSKDHKYICNHGVIYFFADKQEVVFRDIGIVCVKGKSKHDIKEALETRRHFNIDPFLAGFEHIVDHGLIDLSAVRLCFQVFLRGENWTQADLHNLKKYNGPVLLATSSVIYHEKKYGDLKIVYFAGPVVGGREMHLWCNKYVGEDPDVVFEEGREWSEKAVNVVNHQKVAMRFDPPRYPNHPKSTSIKVQVRLRQRAQNGQPIHSNPVDAEYVWRDPRPIPLDYLPSISAKSVDEKIEECRALAQQGDQSQKANVTPSTPRSSDQIQPLPGPGFKSPSSHDGEASCISTVKGHLISNNKGALDEAFPNTDQPMSCTDLTYESNDYQSCEELSPLDKEHITCLQHFDVTLL